MKKFLSFLLVLALGLVFVGCGDETVKPTKIEISGENEVEVGKTINLVATVTPADATDKSVEWSSSDNATATVDKGAVKGVKEGTVTITVTSKVDSAVKAEVKITVKEAAQVVEVKPTSIEVSGENQVEVGKEVTLTAVVKPDNATNKAVTWKSSDETVATVAAGKVKGVKAGTATITVTASADAAVVKTFEITVVEGAEEVNPVLTLSGVYYGIVGESKDIQAIITPEQYANEEVEWISSDDSIATIENGILTCIEAGDVVITAKLVNYPEISVERTITIVALEKVVASVDISIEDEVIYDIDTYKIVKTIDPTDATVSLSYASSDETVATVDKSGNVTTLKVGSVTITATDAVSGLESVLELEVVASPELTGMEIKGREITVEDSCTLAISPLPEHANYTVTWEALTPDIATIDETGKVTPIKDGVAKFKATDVTGVTAEYDLTINKKFNPNEGPDSVAVVFDGEKLVYIGYQLRFFVEVLPAGVSSAVTWELHSKSEGIATLSEDGVLTGIAEGTARVRAVSKINGAKSDWVSIEVKKEKELPPIPDLKGYQIVIMNADSALSDIDPFLEKYAGSDKVFKQRAWTDVENEYNCDIVVKAYPAEAPWGDARVNWIINNATNGTSQLDFGVVSGHWMNTFAQANAAIDTSKYFQLYGKNQIEPALKEASSANGKYYCVSMGLSGTRTYVIGGMFYNYGKVKELGLESPAKLFNEGRWTYEGFVEWCKQAQAILPENNYVLSGGPSIYWSGMVNAAGVKIADKSSMKLNLTHSYAIEAVKSLTEVVANGCYAIDEIGYDQSNTPFNEQRAIMAPGEFWFVRNSGRWPSELWGKGTTEYGYVPFPYPSSVKKEDTKVNFVGESVIMMIAGRSLPVGIEAEGVYRAVQDMYLRTIAYQKADPLYNEEAIKTTALKSRIDDPESITAAMFYDGSKTIFDPLFDQSFQYNWSGETTTAIINSVKGADPIEELDAIFSAVETKFIIAYGSK